MSILAEKKNRYHFGITMLSRFQNENVNLWNDTNSVNVLNRKCGQFFYEKNFVNKLYVKMFSMFRKKCCQFFIMRKCWLFFLINFNFFDKNVINFSKWKYWLFFWIGKCEFSWIKKFSIFAWKLCQFSKMKMLPIFA